MKTVYLLKISSSPSTNDDYTDRVIGVFENEAQAQAWFNELLGMYGDARLDFERDSVGMLYLEDPMPGIISVYIRPITLGRVDPKEGLAVLKDVLRATRTGTD